MPAIGGHHRTQGRTDEWLTPRAILQALGPFDLDPCAPIDRPWPTAAKHCTVEDDGLSAPWEGRIWLNPPYGRQVEDWIQKLAAHGNGIALVFARTETRWFFEHVWPCAAALLFLRGRITFCHPSGVPSRTGHNSGGPSVLIAYGFENARTLKTCGLRGHLVLLDQGKDSP